MAKHNVKKASIPTLEEVEKERKRLNYRKEYNRVLRSTVNILIVVAALAALLATLLLPVLQVSGTSMEPTLVDGDFLVLMKSDRMETGDLCGFYWQNKLLLKRIIGGPGDIIDMDVNGVVSVNGSVLDEPYVSELATGICDMQFPYQVPDKRFFVMGDHRATSVDSRSSTVGCIETEQMVGKVFFRIWPFERISFVK